MIKTSPRLATRQLYIRSRARVLLISIFALIGLLFAVDQVLGESKDYFSYVGYFDLARTEGLDTLVVGRFEPGFSIFTILLTSLFTTNVVVYGWIVAAAMLLKGWAISAYSSSLKTFIIVALFYFVRYFPLHELTQLRAACAIALILVGAIILWEGNVLFGLLICASSILFHVSAVVVIPALFLHFSKRWQVLLVALVVFVLVSALSGFLTDYLGNFIRILEFYQSNGFGEIRASPFAVSVLIDWVMVAVSLIMWNRLSVLMKRIVLLELIGLAIFCGSLDYAVIAHRIRELYSVIWVLFVADGLRQRGTKLMSFGFVFVSIVWYSYVFIISGKFNT